MEQTGSFPMSPETSSQLDSLRENLSQGKGMTHRMMNHVTWPVVSTAAAAIAGGAAFWWYRRHH